VGIYGVIWGVVFVFTYFSYRQQAYGTGGEIRMGSDGTCEFETKRRVIRLHVHEIRSVRYSAKSDGESFYTIHYRSGKLRVGLQMTGFADFLTRLKTLNPAVGLANLPAGAALGSTDIRSTRSGRSPSQFGRRA
jgi:hypothetical protein